MQKLIVHVMLREINNLTTYNSIYTDRVFLYNEISKQLPLHY